MKPSDIDRIVTILLGDFEDELKELEERLDRIEQKVARVKSENQIAAEVHATLTYTDYEVDILTGKRCD